MTEPTRIYRADLAHTYSVDDRSLPIPLGIGYIKAYAQAQFGDALEIKLFKHPERLMAAVHEAPPGLIETGNDVEHVR